MIEVDKPLSFEAFEKIPEYYLVNQKFVEKIPIQNHHTVVEVASGRGKVTSLLLEKAQNAQVICIDSNVDSLIAAKRKSSQPNVHYLQARVEDLAQFLRGRFDGVVIGNAIHNFADKQEVVKTAYSILKPGGFFAFNSAFSQEGIPRSERRFYIAWMMQAKSELVKIGKINPEIIIEGEKPAARKQLSLDEYCKLLEGVGFQIVIDRSEMTIAVDLPPEAFQAISVDRNFISGALQNLNTAKEEYLRIGSDILKNAAASASAQLHKNSSVRIWIQLVAQKL